MHLKKQIVIAVDGHSSCGKSTFAKQIAEKLNYIFIDSGAMYRAVALYALQNNLIVDNQTDEPNLIDQLHSINIHFKRNSEGKIETFLNNKNVEFQIRGIEVSELVSNVSKVKEVRAFLVELQQKMGESKGIVMDGRDIGTVVFPNAEIKLFMTALPKVRAQRRYDELVAKDLNVSFEEIEKNIIARDFNDSNRKESPLKQAEDAHVLDNSYMKVEEQMIWFINLLISKNLMNK